MSVSELAVGDVIDVVKLFPLPGMVLFPRTRVGLHIFEHRYRRMIADALEDKSLVCLGLVTEGASAERLLDPSFVPAVAPLSGIGRIVQSERLADGRYNLILEGIARAHIQELAFVPPYRRVRAEVLGEIGSVRPDEAMALLSCIARFAGHVRRHHARLELDLPAGTDGGVLADACAHQLVIAAEDRQRVLETLDVGERVRLVNEILATQQALLGADQLGSN